LTIEASRTTPPPRRHAQNVRAERYGFDSAWVAQHHFDENEGNLPAPLETIAPSLNGRSVFRQFR
jgi:alkanesulfonate monooxygenase SsuD/methylene tetrahydromethanopterin reductase-like flavin-dependent oxidoreductase (luciferase family)